MTAPMSTDIRQRLKDNSFDSLPKLHACSVPFNFKSLLKIMKSVDTIPANCNIIIQVQTVVRALETISQLSVVAHLKDSRENSSPLLLHGDTLVPVHQTVLFSSGAVLHYLKAYFDKIFVGTLIDLRIQFGAFMSLPQRILNLRIARDYLT